jgi:cell division protease FtsH
MVTKWGLSDKLGPLSYGEDEGEVFLGHSVTQHKAISDDTANAIDEEIRSIIDRNYQRSEKILRENMDKLHIMAETLIKYETIDSDQITDILEGRTPRPPADWEDTDEPKTGSGLGSSTAGKEKPADGAVGGPASQH